MFHPTRDGCRGGQGNFKWEDVQKDKQRGNYLGNSLHAAAGRGSTCDPGWYAKEGAGLPLSTERARLAAEVEEQRAREAAALGHYLSRGFGAPLAPVASATTDEAMAGGGARAREGEPDRAGLHVASEAARRAKAERKAARAAERALREEKRARRAKKADAGE